MNHESVVIVLALGGAPLDEAALDQLPGVAVRWQRVAQEGRVACVAARVWHGDPPAEFGARVREWGRARGWAVTVARCGPAG